MIGATILIGRYFIKTFVEVCTLLKNTLVQSEGYPHSIQIICKSSQIALILGGIVEIFLVTNILKIQGKSREI